MKKTCRFMLCLLLSGCVSERALEWTYDIPAGLERPGTVVVARIRQGGCLDGDELLFESRPRAVRGETEPLPVLVQGITYCFEVRLEDSSCAEYARSFDLVEVDGTQPATVLNELREASSDAPCENALCDAELGCRPCQEFTTFCAAEAGESARCCADAVATCAASDALLCESFD